MDKFNCKNCGEEIVRMKWMTSGDVVKCISCDKKVVIPDFPKPIPAPIVYREVPEVSQDEEAPSASDNMEGPPLPLITVKGRAKTLVVYKSKVCIAPSSGFLGGAFALAGEGACEVRIKNITSIEYAEATTLKMGYLVINYPGAPGGRHGIVGAEDNTNNNNSLTFSKGANVKMREAKAVIEKIMEEIDALQDSNAKSGLIQQNNTKWEYRILKHEISCLDSESEDATDGLKAKLNKLGVDKWEISGTCPVGKHLVVTLKRPIF